MTAKAFRDAIIEVSERYACPFDSSIKNLPHWRVSKQETINRLTQKNKFDVIPTLPANFKETDAIDFNAKKICSSTLDSSRHKMTLMALNQTLMSFHKKSIR